MRGGNDPKLTRSVRRHIREEKARIRRDVEDAAEQERRTAELYQKFGVAR